MTLVLPILNLNCSFFYSLPTFHLILSHLHLILEDVVHMMVYPEVSGLATWSENCKWHSSLPLRAVVSLICESV
jgi:hypothetical protein